MTQQTIGMLIHEQLFDALGEAGGRIAYRQGRYLGKAAVSKSFEFVECAREDKHGNSRDVRNGQRYCVQVIDKRQLQSLTVQRQVLRELEVSLHVGASCPNPHVQQFERYLEDAHNLYFLS